jgi:hypothetical protein
VHLQSGIGGFEFTQVSRRQANVEAAEIFVQMLPSTRPRMGTIHGFCASSQAFTVDDRIVEYEIGGSHTISDSLFSVEAALEGVGLAYTFEQFRCLTSGPKG